MNCQKLRENKGTFTCASCGRRSETEYVHLTHKCEAPQGTWFEWFLAACVATFLLLLAILVGSTGCSSTQLRTVQALECRIALLEPYLGPLTEELVSEGIRNPGAVVDALMSLGLSPTSLEAL